MFRSFFVGAALAASALTASAAATVLTFEDLPPPDGFFDATLYHGFDLSNALTGNAGTNYWALGTPDYPSFGTTNASVDGPAGAFSAFAITAPTLFTFTAATFTGGGQDIYVVAVDKNDNKIAFGTFNPDTLVGAPSFNLLADGMEVSPTGARLVNFVNTNFLNTQLKSIAFYGEANTFAVDNIVLTPVPEANAFALTAVGLGVLGLMSRRRKQAGSAAA